MKDSISNNKSLCRDKTINNEREIPLSEFVLAGNPNVGKSVIFTELTGAYVDVSNYPGTTVEIYQAHIGNSNIIDTPGIYGVGSYNAEETVAKDILLLHDKVINVVSATSLEKDLFLTQQLIDMGYSLVVVLNQMDEAKSKGIKINIEKLKQHLGVEIFPTVATKKIGIDNLKNNLSAVRKGHNIPEITKLSEALIKLHLTPAEAILALEGDSSVIVKYPGLNIQPQQEKIYSLRREHIDKIIKDCITETMVDANLSTKIGHWLLNPFIGLAVAVLVLMALYVVIAVVIAGNIVGYTEGLVNNYYAPWMQGIINSFISTSWLNELLVGKFGVLTMTVQYLVGLLLPLVVGFYVFFAFLEDSGYLPRLAVLSDRALGYIGLNGRAIIPLLLGFGCITMAIISSRILNSNRERIIAIAILALALPCSAQIGIILALLSAASTFWAWIVYLATILTVLIIVSVLLNKYLPGESTPLMLDLPPMRWPNVKNVFSKTVHKTGSFLMEAGPIFAFGTLVLGVLSITGALEQIQSAISVVVVNFLHLPKETANAFIMGMIRRDFAAAGLAELAGLGSAKAIMSPVQIVVSLVVITLFVPCLASIMVIFKERGLMETILIWVTSILVAFITGGILSFILNLIF